METDGRYVSTDWGSTVVTCPRIAMSSVDTRVDTRRSTVVMCGVRSRCASCAGGRLRTSAVCGGT
eukprot:9478582-Pyramimonas_sp.AAC.2